MNERDEELRAIYTRLYSDKERPYVHGPIERTWTQCKGFIDTSKMSIVDLGCGYQIAKRIMPHKSYVGVDIADGIGTIQASLTALPFKNEEFDLAVNVDVLEHLHPEDVDAAINEIYRVSSNQLISICCIQARFDETLHLTVREPEWWLDKLPYNYTYTSPQRSYVTVLCGPDVKSFRAVKDGVNKLISRKVTQLRGESKYLEALLNARMRPVTQEERLLATGADTLLPKAWIPRSVKHG